MWSFPSNLACKLNEIAEWKACNWESKIFRVFWTLNFCDFWDFSQFSSIEEAPIKKSLFFVSFSDQVQTPNRAKKCNTYLRFMKRKVEEAVIAKDVHEKIQFSIDFV